MRELELTSRAKDSEFTQAAEWSPLTRLRDDLGNLMEQFMGSAPWGGQVTCDDSEREYVVRAVAPGFEVEDFDIQVSGPQLIIKAERKQEASADNSHQWMEGRLYRSLPLPGGVDTEGIQAEYRSGILLLRLPKAADSKVKRIQVRAT